MESLPSGNWVICTISRMIACGHFQKPFRACSRMARVKACVSGIKALAPRAKLANKTEKGKDKKTQFYQLGTFISIILSNWINHLSKDTISLAIKRHAWLLSWHCIENRYYHLWLFRDPSGCAVLHQWVSRMNCKFRAGRSASFRWKFCCPTTSLLHWKVPSRASFVTRFFLYCIYHGVFKNHVITLSQNCLLHDLSQCLSTIMW